MITVKYFASLREEVGRGEECVAAEGVRNVRDVWCKARAEALPANILMAVNQTYATPDSPVTAGDEVAFFPPVTGG